MIKVKKMFEGEVSMGSVIMAIVIIILAFALFFAWLFLRYPNMIII